MSTESKSDRDTAGVIAPPPLIYASVLALGTAINFYLAINFIPSMLALVIGIPLITFGLILGLYAIIAMHRANTSPEPWAPTRALVTDGPFHLTRNPIYLAFALIYLGITCAMNALAVLILFPIAIGVIHFGVILREEKYLAQKFGDAYLQYQLQVRRWI